MPIAKRDDDVQAGFVFLVGIRLVAKERGHEARRCPPGRKFEHVPPIHAAKTSIWFRCRRQPRAIPIAPRASFEQWVYNITLDSKLGLLSKLSSTASGVCRRGLSGLLLRLLLLSRASRLFSTSRLSALADGVFSSSVGFSLLDAAGCATLLGAPCASSSRHNSHSAFALSSVLSALLLSGFAALAACPAGCPQQA